MAEAPPSPVTAPPPFAQSAGASSVDLRPLSTSELIDRGFTLYRTHFAGFLLLALLCQTAPLLGQILATAFKLNPTQSEILENTHSFFNKVMVIVVITLVTQLIVFCCEVVLNFYIADAYLGKVPSVKKSIQQFTKRIGASLWTCVLNRFLIGTTLIFPVLTVVAAALYIKYHPPVTLTSLLIFGLTVLFLLIVSLIPLLIVFMRLMATIPAMALENLSGWKAIKRSSQLVRYDPGLGFFYWGEMRLSFLLLPLFIIELLILSLTSLPLTVHQIEEIMRHGSGGQIAPPPDSAVILSQVLTFLAGSLIVPLYSIATTLFYYDIRIRREGFDLEFLSGQLGEQK